MGFSNVSWACHPKKLPSACPQKLHESSATTLHLLGNILLLRQKQKRDRSTQRCKLDCARKQEIGAGVARWFFLNQIYKAETIILAISQKEKGLIFRVNVMSQPKARMCRRNHHLAGKCPVVATSFWMHSPGVYSLSLSSRCQSNEI
mmetsp:Transcript_30010/g.45511  ORF Transcript_30010/g.45511 Transcript_30010/m.45511 type:complete len:147 (+) Transcript_30010:927-1367(+)